MMLRELITAYIKVKDVSLRTVSSEIGIKHTVLWRFMRGDQIHSDHYIAIVRWILCK